MLLETAKHVIKSLLHLIELRKQPLDSFDDPLLLGKRRGEAP